MTLTAIICAAILGLAGLLTLLRLVRGPTTLDRTIATDVFVATSIAAIAIEAAINQHNTTLPILAALSFVAFLGSVSVARYAAAPNPSQQGFASNQRDDQGGRS